MQLIYRNRTFSLKQTKKLLFCVIYLQYDKLETLTQKKETKFSKNKKRKTNSKEPKMHILIITLKVCICLLILFKSQHDFLDTDRKYTVIYYTKKFTVGADFDFQNCLFDAFCVQNHCSLPLV